PRSSTSGCAMARSSRIISKDWRKTASPLSCGVSEPRGDQPWPRAPAAVCLDLRGRTTPRHEDSRASHRATTFRDEDRRPLFQGGGELLGSGLLLPARGGPRR